MGHVAEPGLLPAAAELRAAWKDFVESVRRLRLVVWLASRETLLPFRDAKLGPYWMTIHLAVWSVSIGYLFGPHLGTGTEQYVVYVTLGMTIFTVMQIFISEGSRAFVGESNAILNIPNPFLIYVLKLVTKSGIQIAMSIPVIAAVMLIARSPIEPTVFAAIPGLVLLLTAGFGASLLLGILAVRYRDIIFAASTLMRFLLFVTPVFWFANDVAGPRHIIALINPLYHFMTIVRDPLMGRMPPIEIYVTCCTYTAVVLLLGFGLFAKMRGRMAVWL